MELEPDMDLDSIDEIDDIEHEIREQVPEAQHLDLEAD